MPFLRSRAALFVFLAVYAAILIVLLPGKPLWVDEIIDLGGVRNADLRGVLDFVPQNAGGVPLGYLIDFWMIRLFGYSVFIVRLPSVLFTVWTCAAVYILAWKAGVRAPLLAAVLYAVSPLTMRYAQEARAYAQAACWSALATVVFLSLVRKPTVGKAARYAALIAAGLYTQPYSVFIPVAHLIWLALTKNLRALRFAGIAAAAAGLAFLPWFLKTHATWQGIVASGTRFAVNVRDLAVIPHELMGTGYAGAALTVITAVVALAWSPLKRQDKLFWSLCGVAPILLVPAADAYFGYFLAARQMIFALAPILILIAACADIRRWGIVLPAILLALMLYEDIRWIRRPGEAWEAAAAQLKEASCTIFIPSGARTMYVYFDPQLRVCNENMLTPLESIAVAVNADQPASALLDTRQKLDRAGFRKVADLRTQDPRIELYRREPR